MGLSPDALVAFAVFHFFLHTFEKQQGSSLEKSSSGESFQSD